MRLASYANVAPNIGTVVASGKATLLELDTVYGVKDLYDLLEIIAVSGNNQRAVNKKPGTA